jgi:hypothetical protein
MRPIVSTVRLLKVLAKFRREVQINFVYTLIFLLLPSEYLPTDSHVCWSGLLAGWCLPSRKQHFAQR